ncbi:hypothetical protein [Hymenobacter canadensis]|uniref:PD-(D/E)XK endonuclease-like domain-containing protein n=1 Tax=Hymenobacter canadensis TaxID=2999067 RepID=A0ABY7LWS2_9BACT|nr:hypothetical protein [Hymenobacter canadensis]WBA44049.1 hypothetical protein O3303_21035 [Hymenobacter canadensis]
MFDLTNIDVIKTDAEHGLRSYSFVGLKRKNDSDRLEFWLPIGFNDFEPSFEAIKKFFFKMYRTFQVYRERKMGALEEDWRTTDRDGVFEFENGFSFINERNEHVIFYGKLNSLDKILEGYDELRISSLEKKKFHSLEIDYSQIDRYMHRAYFLEDDIIYLDEMTIPKSVIIQDSPSIVQLFCFIYTEIKKELEEVDSTPDRAFELAAKFKEEFLEPGSSLFDEESFDNTIFALRSVFEEIEDKTTYKDDDFWHFYEAVEAFLFGQKSDDKDGIYFGINNFYDVWEDMCQAYMLSKEHKHLEQVLFADVKGRLLTRKDLGVKPYINMNPFAVKINNEPRNRYLRPDLVLLESVDYEGSTNYLESKLLNKIFSANRETFELNDNFYTNHKIKFNTNIIENFPELYQIYLKHLNKNKKYIDSGRKTYYEYIRHSNYDDFAAEVSAYVCQVNEYFAMEKGLISSIINVIDYKYMRLSDYITYDPSAINNFGENKIKDDIHKQLVYEWAIQNNISYTSTKSEFWIPFYSDDLSIEKQKYLITNSHFQTNQIDVIQVNFKVLQENYIKLNTLL